MAPPPVTPSPHRFVIKKQPLPPRSQIAQQHTPQPGSTQQFNATPRFTFSSTPRPTGTQNIPSSTPAAARYITPARQAPSLRETIDDPSDDFADDLHDSVEPNDVNADIGFFSDGAEDDYEIDTRDTKRRRISRSPEADLASEHNDETKDGIHDSLSSSLPLLSSPVARRPISTSKPKFLLSTPAPPPATPQSTAAATTFLKPPRFRPPDPAERTESNLDPLPEQFSPHRRGQKYVPGGLAAEVRDWLVNLDSALPSHAIQKTKEDAWIVKLVIDEVSGGSRAGMTLVRGRQIHNESGDQVVDSLGIVKVILAGEGAGMGLQKGSKVEVGKVVGMKGPVWEVVIEGEKWGVGVDWKVLG